MFPIIDRKWCLWKSTVSMKFLNMELLISSSTVSFFWKKIKKKKPEIIQTTKYASIAHFWCPLEKCWWLFVFSSVSLKNVISWPFLATDNLLSKQVGDNKQKKFWDFNIDFEKKFGSLINSVVLCLKNIKTLEERKWNGKHYQPPEWSA